MTASIEKDGWALMSAEQRHLASHSTFVIPSKEARASLQRGDAAKLLFDMETKENGRVLDRGVDRMWVIVKSVVGETYRGILDSDPGRAEGLRLRPGMEIIFGPEHVVDIERPPRAYVLEKYGAAFFEE